MSISLVLFYGLGILTLGAAFGSVVTRNVVHAVLFLLASLTGVAGLFVLLLAEFLALVQILIYGGAITMVLLFAIMLTRNEEFASMRDNPQRPLAVAAGLGVFGVLAAAMLITTPRVTVRQAVAFDELGARLFSQWAIPFEVASLVLLVALVGAILIARAGGRE